MKRLVSMLLIGLAASCGGDGGEDANDGNATTADTGVTTPDAGADADASGTEDSGVEYGEPRTENVFDAIRISSIREDEFFQEAIAPVDFGEGPFERATLKVQLETSCFPFSEWTQPPAGHRWPADCDAFDRNFEFTLDPARDDGDPPGFELVRAITPFGGPMTFEVDITDLANARPGLHDMKVRIATWPDPDGQVSGSAGGWNVTAEVELVPGAPPRDVVDVVSLFNGNQRVETGLSRFDVEIPDEASRAVLEYRVTGHGGADRAGDPACIGGAEEFCQRTHYVTAFGRPEQLVPWRDDCDTLCTLTQEGTNFQYCQENPCGSIQSVRAPRANWCPGDITPPFTWEADGLTGGTRPVEFSVEGIADGGSWRTSATVYFYRD
jgi:hypothetical protein